MISSFVIYGLTDPRTRDVRYIGKSVSGMARPLKHRQPAQLLRKCHRNSWIRALHARGESYGIAVLEECASREDLNDVECFWIAQGKGLGWRLTNMTKGGDGNVFMYGNQYAKNRSAEAQRRETARLTGSKLSVETRAKMSASQLQAQGTPAKKAAASQLQKKRWADPAYRAMMLAARSTK